MRSDRQDLWREPSFRVAVFVLAMVVGAGVGLGAFTALYARGLSYLANDAGACANCHVMRSHYDAWEKSSHRAAAVCNDCHTPAGFFARWWTKGRNGYHHATAFTTGDFPDPIVITERNLEIVEGSCAKCHEAMTAAVAVGAGGADPPSCVRCHRDVGHAL